MLQRRPLLAHRDTHQAFVRYAHKNLIRGLLVGRYVLMPDHLHFFVGLLGASQLVDSLRLMKQDLSVTLRNRGERRPYWQPGFFDHVVRNETSYAQKWEYVRDNPVRAGLV
ncbi:MAG: transposase, partial [Acidobacteriota bacterium]